MTGAEGIGKGETRTIQFLDELVKRRKNGCGR